MVQIVVTAELASQISQSQEAVVIVGPTGEPLGTLQRSAFTEEEIREAERRLDEPGESFTTAQVLERLRSLESQ